MIQKSFKYRLNPKKSQIEILNKHLGCARYIYNWALETKKTAYQNNKQKLSCFDLINRLPSLKKNPDTSWLSEVSANTLQQSVRHLDSSFQNFFKHKKGFPRFKSKHRRQSFSCPQKVKVNFHNSTVFLPKIGEVKFWNSREFEGKIKTCTVSKSTTGKYYISILVEVPGNPPDKPEVTEKDSIGIDLGLNHFCILSTGEKVENPRHLRKSEKRLKCIQRRHSRKKKGSKNREKSRIRLARVHEKIRNQRSDFLHKTSSKIVSENQTMIMEDLNIAGMIKNHCLAKSISDASWSEFVRQIKYKSNWYGKNFLQCGRFDPTSKMCSCGVINHNLTLDDRIWECEDCTRNNDRDILGAQNVKKFGLRDYFENKNTGGLPGRASGDTCMLEGSKEQFSKRIVKKEESAKIKLVEDVKDLDKSRDSKV